MAVSSSDALTRPPGAVDRASCSHPQLPGVAPVARATWVLKAKASQATAAGELWPSGDRLLGARPVRKRAGRKFAGSGQVHVDLRKTLTKVLDPGLPRSGGPWAHRAALETGTEGALPSFAGPGFPEALSSAATAAQGQAKGAAGGRGPGGAHGSHVGSCQGCRGHRAGFAMAAQQDRRASFCRERPVREL